MTRRTVGVALVCVAALGQIVIYLVAAPEHVLDTAWPLHARFHVMQAIGWVVAANLAVLGLAFWPLRRRDRWAWWTLAAVWPFLQASYFISMLAVPGGGPPEMSAHVFVAIPAVLYLAGLIVTLR